MVKCDACGVTRPRVAVALKQGWCRHTYKNRRTVRWSCVVCQQAQTKRAMTRNPNRKRFHLHVGAQGA